MTRLALILLTLTALAACTVGPNYQRPEVTTGDRFKGAQPIDPALAKAGATPLPLRPDWWTVFNDPQLTDLEEQAVQSSNDLAAATARVLQARAQARIAQSAFYPVITLDPSVGRSRTPSTSGGGSGASGGGGREANFIRVPFDLTYEVDVWGRVRRSVEVATAQLRAIETDYQVILLTLQADIAQDYFAIRALDLQQQIFDKTVQSYRQQLELVQTQYKAGVLARIDVVQAEAQLQSTLAQQADIRRQREDLEHAIAILLGKPPIEVSIAVRPLDLTPPELPVILPAELLRRRPDIAEAEQNLIAANAEIGVATAALYPTLQLSASGGFQGVNLRDALDWQGRAYSIAAGLTMPIFEGGRLEAGVENARARYNELVANYRGAILLAVRDMEDALTDLQRRAEQAQSQDAAVRASREYLELAQQQYKQGLVGYLQVIDAQRTLLNNEIAAAQTLQQRLTSSVLLIKAMGGGWEVPMEPLAQTPGCPVEKSPD